MEKFLQGKTANSAETILHPCLPLPRLILCPGYKRGTFEPGKSIWEKAHEEGFHKVMESWWLEHTLDIHEGKGGFL